MRRGEKGKMRKEVGSKKEEQSSNHLSIQPFIKH